MARKPVEHPAPEWYQTGKELLQHDSKEPRTNKLFGEYSNSGKQKQALKMTWLRDFHQETVSVGNSDPLYIEDTTAKVTLLIEPGSGGSANVQYTIDPIATVHNETATWTDWSTGSVNSSTLLEVDRQFTAIRLVASTADASWSVRISG